jgi:hypothetical protein
MPSSNDTTSETILSYDELSHLLVDPDMLYRISRTFASHPTSTTTLRYYRFLSLSIDRLELDLERHRLEQQALFTHLMDCRTFRTLINPTVQEYRQRAHFHPYERSPSPLAPPSSNNHVDPPRASTSHHVDINEEVNRLLSETNIVFDDKEPANGHQNGIVQGVPGSKWNPIVIRDDKDVCARCNQKGHQWEDCDTPMRSFQHCAICAWTKQAECNHVDASPAWLKELKTNFEKKNH